MKVSWFSMGVGGLLITTAAIGTLASLGSAADSSIEEFREMLRGFVLVPIAILGGLLALVAVLCWVSDTRDGRMSRPHRSRQAAEDRADVKLWLLICGSIVGGPAFAALAAWSFLSSDHVSRSTVKGLVLGVPLGLLVFTVGVRELLRRLRQGPQELGRRAKCP